MDSNDTNTENEAPLLAQKDDGQLALIILIGAVALVFSIGIYLWRSKRILSGPDNSWKQSQFTPPPERALYLAAKEKIGPAVAVSVLEQEELKKLLMRRAIKTIPTLLSLQSEGSSIERLYKRGMLTDDMHFKVKELKAFVDQEFQDVQAEAEALLEGWGAHVWQQAMQFHQMIQKQAESKQQDQKAVEDEKKKSKKGKKVKKETNTEGTAAGGSGGEDVRIAGSDYDGVLLAPSSSGAGVGATVAAGEGGAGAGLEPPPGLGAGAGAGSTPVISADAQAVQAAEAERMAQQLLEEEERERKRASGSGGGGGGKKKKNKK